MKQILEPLRLTRDDEPRASDYGVLLSIRCVQTHRERLWELHAEVPNGGTGLHMTSNSFEDIYERASAVLGAGYGQET